MLQVVVETNSTSFQCNQLVVGGFHYRNCIAVWKQQFDNPSSDISMKSYLCEVQFYIAPTRTFGTKHWRGQKMFALQPIHSSLFIYKHFFAESTMIVGTSSWHCKTNWAGTNWRLWLDWNEQELTEYWDCLRLLYL